MTMPLLLSCSAEPTREDRYVPNARIIERDLLAVPEAIPSETTPAPASFKPSIISPVVIQTASTNEAIEGGQSSTSPEASRHPVAFDDTFFVQFGNESADLDPSSLPTEKLRAQAEAGAHFFVIGQSHGASAVGTQRLSALRAERVAAALRDLSIDGSRIHTLAAWSTQKVSFAPSRGVNIVVVHEASPQWQALLALQMPG
jgi:hypothetical protein